ncbi:MAG: 4Fe-4S binding protein [Deltaproteobacteria bacterium]|nr:4Fe-4S binding protein [Deltaproteobacteria bacterium]
MDEAILRALCDNLNVRGGSIPAMACPQMFELLDELFTLEEAEVACKMPAAAVSARDLSESLGRPIEEILPLLESMADKATVVSRTKDGVVLYKLMPIMPGIFEFQFMRGAKTERDRRLAKLFRRYLNLAEAETEKAIPIPKDVTPFMRVLPVERTIEVAPQVYTFEQLSKYIDSADAISVGHCYCRHEAYLLGEELCDTPVECCMSFGPGAEYTAERGIARAVTKQEAREILERCEKSGLVHMSSNTTKYLEFICNCCGCHCGVLKKLNEMGRPVWSATSGYQARVREETCDGCGTCEEYCQMKAVSLSDDGVSVIDEIRCIGCGICASLCPSEAISMELREEIPNPPETPKDLRTAIMKDFQRAMSKQK